jgi:hypothetical protein
MKLPFQRTLQLLKASRPWCPQGTLGASCGALPHRQRRQCRRIRGRHGRGAVPLTPRLESADLLFHIICYILMDMFF